LYDLPPLPVFLSWGKWVAKCPRPGCFNAEQFGPTGQGDVGGLTGESFWCREMFGGCGLRCPVAWPGNVDSIEFMVRSRPVAARNWLPGETVEDLLRENLEHGLMPRNEMNILDGRVEVLGEIDAPEPRLILTGGA
jgi:hypothetical protein